MPENSPGRTARDDADDPTQTQAQQSGGGETNPDRADSGVSWSLESAGAGHLGTLAQAGHPSVLGAPGTPEIPGYSVAREIARGGMGAVFEARDLSLGRDVAIKVLLPECASADAAQRFIVEAKITARLPHPGIPPVHELGVLSGGYPFLAMKLIRGRTLAQELRRADRVADLPRFIQVFEQIAQAVGFAHSEGVIHRDLKPANVMVGAFGEVQVMDWGLAKEMGAGDGGARSEDEPRFAVYPKDGRPGFVTQAGYVMGTPAYMAPEQARGKGHDARIDVFALGGILCDILTGSPPFVGDTVEETVKLAGAGKVDTAFSLLDGCDADPELITLCKWMLAPRPQDRPLDGTAVARAIASYRAGVEARFRKAESERAAAEARAAEEANTRREAEARAVEQRKRQRVQLALFAAVGALLGLVLLGAWWWDRAAEQRKLEQSEADARTARSEAARLEAEAEAERRGREVKERLTRNREEVANLLRQVEAMLRKGDAGRAGEAFGQAEKRFAEGGADDLKEALSRCRVELAVLRQLDVADGSQWNHGSTANVAWSEIEPLFARAFAELGIIPGTTPPDEAARVINGSLIRERLLISLEVWFSKSGGKPAPFAVLSAADPDEFRNEARTRSYSYAVLARAIQWRPVPFDQPIWFAIGHAQGNRITWSSAGQLLLSAYRVTPDSFPLLMTLGGHYGRLGKATAAQCVGWYRGALAVQPNGAAAWNNLGGALADAGDFPGAIVAYREAIRIEPRAAHHHSNLGAVLCDSGDLTAGLAELREAIRLDPSYPTAHYNLGYTLQQSGDFAGAIAPLREAIRLRPDFAPSHGTLGFCLLKTGDNPGAVAAYRESLRLNPYQTPLRLQLASILSQSSDTRATIMQLLEAVQREPGNAKAHFDIGRLLRQLGDLDGAVSENRTAIRLEPKFVQAHVNLAAGYCDLKRYPEAIASAREAVRLAPGFHMAHGVLGYILRESGDIEGARAALTRAAQLDAKTWEKDLRSLPAKDAAPPPREVKP